MQIADFYTCLERRQLGILKSEVIFSGIMWLWKYKLSLSISGINEWLKFAETAAGKYLIYI